VRESTCIAVQIVLYFGWRYMAQFGSLPGRVLDALHWTSDVGMGREGGFAVFRLLTEKNRR